eukprot:COSAG02_NODE_274_length_26244_cov_36.943507_18_plen_213_part_00
MIVNTGSKQGITMPPGDTAYNVSKSGVKTLTEGLQHTLREIPGCRVNAFLLVPGWTITMIGTKSDQRLQGSKWDPNKAQDERSYDGVQDPNVAQNKLEARGAWPADKVVDRMMGAVNTGAPFYIICPDNETTEACVSSRLIGSISFLPIIAHLCHRLRPAKQLHRHACAATRFYPLGCAQDGRRANAVGCGRPNLQPRPIKPLVRLSSPIQT